MVTQNSFVGARLSARLAFCKLRFAVTLCLVFYMWFPLVVFGKDEEDFVESVLQHGEYTWKYYGSPYYSWGVTPEPHGDFVIPDGVYYNAAAFKGNTRLTSITLSDQYEAVYDETYGYSLNEGFKFSNIQGCSNLHALRHRKFLKWNVDDWQNSLNGYALLGEWCNIPPVRKDQIREFYGLPMDFEIIFAGGSGLTAVGSGVTISNVRASQRAGTQYVDVFYDLGANVNGNWKVQLNIDTGDTNFLAHSCYYHVGEGVSPGKHRYITWDAGKDWPGKHATCVATIKIESISASSSAFSLDTRSDAFTIDDISSEFCSGEYGGIIGRKATFLTGVRNNGLNDVRFTVKTSGGELDYVIVDDGSGPFADSATFSLDVGAYAPGAVVTVRAHSKDDKWSKPFRLNFDIADYPPLWSQNTLISAHRDVQNKRIVYASSEIAVAWLWEELSDGLEIGDFRIPLRLTPKMDIAQIMESDTGQYKETLDVGGCLGKSYGELAEIGTGDLVGPKQNMGVLGNAAITAEYSGSDVYEWNPKSASWGRLPSERGVKFSGSCDFKTRIPQTGNIVYVKIGAAVGGELLMQHIDDIWYYKTNLDPFIALRGTLGAGVEGLACLEGYGQGGVFLNLESPGMPDVLKDAGFEFKAGWNFVLFGFARNGEATWKGYLKGGPTRAKAMRILSAVLSEERESDFKLIGREYRKSSRRRMLSKSGDSSALSLGDGYPNPSPSLSIKGTAGNLVYLRDNSERTDINRTELVYRNSTFSAFSSYEWNGEEPVWDDGTADFMPKVAAGKEDGLAFAAWANAKRVLSNSDSFETVCKSLELAVGVRDATTGTWSCQNLTDDAALDMNPVLRAAADGSAAVAWMRNAAGDFMGSDASSSSIMLSFYRNGAWTTPRKVADAGALTSLDLAYDGSTAKIVWSRDGDGDMSTSGDREVWGTTVDNGVFGAATRFSAQGVDATRPYVWFDSSLGAQYVWLEDGVLTAGGESGGTAIQGAAQLNLPEDFRLVPRSDGGATLAWWQSDKTGIGGRLMCATFIPSSGTVGMATELVGNDAAEGRNVAASVDGGDVLNVVYESVAMSTNAAGDVQFGNVNMETYRGKASHSSGAVLSITPESMSFMGLNAADKTGAANARLRISNYGGKEATNAVVWLWQGVSRYGNRICVATTNVLPYSAVEMDLSWRIEWTDRMTNAVFLVELDPENKYGSMKSMVWQPYLGEPELALCDARCVNVSDMRRLVQATVRNTGAVPLTAGTTVNFWRGDVGGQLLGTDVLGEMAFGEEWRAGLELNVADIAAFGEDEQVVIEVVAGRAHPVSSVRVMKTLMQTPTTCVVTFNANGGTVSEAFRIFQPNAALGALPVPEKDGYTFAGWWTTMGGGTQITTSTTVGDNVTYYAHWTPNTYTVTYNPGSYGTGSLQTETKTGGVALTLKDAIFTRTGYTQTGWTTSDGGAIAYGLSEFYSTNAAIMLYPFWTANTYLVTLDRQGGYGSTTNVLATYDSAMPAIAVPTRPNFTFGGYYTSTGGSGTRYYTQSGASARTWDMSKETTLYAKWVPVPPTFSISDGVLTDVRLNGTTDVEIPDDVMSIGYRAFWNSREMATSVSIPNGVTNIGDFAFYWCRGLTNLTIGSSVTSVGEYAFYGCSGLMSLTIPGNVTSIGEYAFYGCSGLMSLTIPGNVTSIGPFAFSGCSGLMILTIMNGVASIENGAFRNCDGLRSIALPVSVTNVGSFAFSGRGVTSFSVDSDNPCYKSVSGVLLTKDGNLLVAGVNGDVVIPSGVTSVGDRAFIGCSGLTSVVIPSSVTNIWDYAFGGCTNLTSVTIPDSVTGIGNRAFSNCSGLANVVMPRRFEEIAGNIFEGCSSEMQIAYYDSFCSVTFDLQGGSGGTESVTATYGSAMPPVTVPMRSGYKFAGYYTEPSGGGARYYYATGSSARTWDRTSATTLYAHWTEIKPEFAIFDGVLRQVYPNGFEEVEIPSSVRSIGEGAFANCSNLTSVTIPNSVTNIDRYAFAGCRRLASMDIPGSVVSIGESAFIACSGLSSITIPNGVASMGNGVFNGCTNLTSVTVSQNVCSEGMQRMFESACRSITNVVISEGVTVIEDGVFYGCPNLASLTLPNSIRDVDYWAFDGFCNLRRVTVPQYVFSKGLLNVFGPAGRSITDIFLSDDVDQIKRNAFVELTELRSITVAENNTTYASVNGLLLSKDRRTLIRGVNGDITIPECVRTIGDGAFYGCGGLARVTIPDSVTRIESYAFRGCTNLTEVAIPAGVEYVGNSAFAECMGLVRMTFYGNAPSIGGDCFANVNSSCTVFVKKFAGWGWYVEELEKHYGLKVEYLAGLIVDGVLEQAYHYGLTEYVVPDGVKTIREYAFRDCQELTSLTIPNSVTNIERWAFDNCYNLVSVAIPQYICERELYDVFRSRCDSITNVVINDGVIAIGGRAFCNCHNLVGITIPDSVMYIGDAAFDNCYNLMSVAIPDSVTYIGNWAFDSCHNLKSVTVPQAACSIGLTDVFRDAHHSITNICLSDNVYRVEGDDFLNFTELAAITVSEGNAVYKSVDGLLLSKDGETLIRGVNGIVVIPDGVRSVRELEFAFCEGLVSVTVPDSVTDIGYVAFQGCTGLQSVSLPAHFYRNLDLSVFRDCPENLIVTYRDVVVSSDVIFDANGGMFSDGKAKRCIEAPPGNLWGKLPMPALSGQVFDGWYTEKDELVDASSTVPAANATYYAHWTPRLSLAAASEWGGAFETDSWCGQGSVAHDGKDALRSGIIYNNQSSYIRTTVTGAGTLSFWWAVSCEAGGNDKLIFLVDGVQKKYISGERDWAQVVFAISGAGEHVIEWRYTKNATVTKGEDFGWLDQISWVAAPVEASFVFDANGGKFSNGATVKKTDATPGNLWGKMYMPAKDGQVFAGWYTAPEGGTLVTSSSVVPDYYTTYYAHWTPRLGLAAASEWSRAFETDSWCGQGAVSHDGKDALRSGIIYDGQSSYMITRVPGPGTLTFWWKVSCEAGGNDALRFLLDGVQKYSISGEKDWAKVTVDVTGSGTHILKWNYTKNASISKGQDFGWIDQIGWTAK